MLMKKRTTQIGILTLSILTSVVVALQTQSRFSLVVGQQEIVWHHYNKKTPTQSERGIREYWANCGGNYHQFTAPTSGTIVDMGSAYDTSEFTPDDDRWLTYCDEHGGHSLGSYDICGICGQIEGELLYPYMIEGSTKITNMDPINGFNSVYKLENINRGAFAGVDVDISNYQYIYFALMETTCSDLYVYGGDNRYAKLTQNTWTYFLFVRDKSTDKLALYTRNNLYDSWDSKYLDSADEETTNLSRLRFYNWDGLNYTVYCSEVYAVEIEDDPCEHVYDEHDVCTLCMKHKNSTKAYNYAVSGSTKSTTVARADGFKNVYSVTGKTSGCEGGVDLDISDLNYLYFALYASGGYVRPFNGGDEGDGSHCIVWSGRWWYLLVEKINGEWKGYIRESGTEQWYTRTVDRKTATNFSSMLLLYNWSGLEGVTIYSTEIYCDVEAPAPVENAQALNIGVWNGSYHFTNTSSIDDMVTAGMNTIIGVNPRWNPNWNAVLNYAQSKGVKFIVDPRGWDTDHYVEWDGTCPSYANHQAVQGFIMYDEPSTLLFDQLAQQKTQFESVMPSGKLFFVNLLSSAVGMSSLYGSEKHQSSYSYYETNYAEAYDSKVSPDLYSYDSYPIFTNGQIRKSYFCSLDIWSNLSRSLGVPTWFTFLSAAHDAGDGPGYSYPLPTKLQLTWQMSVAVSFGITNLMHYIYATDASDYSCMANIDGTKNAQFDVVCEANSNMHAIDNDLANYGWEGAVTYHNNNKMNLLFKDLKHTLSNSQVDIKSINATSDLLIGSYVDESENRAYMVTNSGISTDYSSTWAKNYRDYNANVAYTNEANNVSLTVNSNITGAYVIQNGVRQFVAANNNTIQLKLEAYGSAFVVLQKQS